MFPHSVELFGCLKKQWKSAVPDLKELALHFKTCLWKKKRLGRKAVLHSYSGWNGSWNSEMSNSIKITRKISLSSRKRDLSETYRKWKFSKWKWGIETLNHSCWSPKVGKHLCFLDSAFRIHSKILKHQGQKGQASPASQGQTSMGCPRARRRVAWLKKRLY